MKKIFLLLITTLFITYSYAQVLSVNEKESGESKADIVNPPVDLSATFSDPDVTLSWMAPGSAAWFGYSEAINANGVGPADGGSYTVAQRYDNDMLAAYDGMSLTKVEIFVRSQAYNVVLKVWTGANASNLVYSKAIDPTIGEFFQATIDEPILIDASEELWVGYDITNTKGTKPAGTDAGPAIPNYGDMISIAGSAWVSMSTDYGLDYNFNITCFAVTGESALDIVKIKDLRTEVATNVTLSESTEKGTSDSRGAAALNGYNIYRGGIKINASLVTETTYVDLDVPGGFHKYTVTAVYDDGESDPSNEIEVAVMRDMVEREFVVVEIATATWCTYCPGAAMGADDLVANGKKVAIIEYHGGDSYATTNSDARNSYYPVGGFPTATFDGAYSKGGGNHSQSLYSHYLPIYEELKTVESAYEITLNGNTNGRNVTLNGTVKRVGTRISDDLLLHLSITESEIAESWQGQSKLDYVSRDMLPNSDGTELDFSSTDEISFEFETELDANWNTDHIEFTAFVQSEGSKKIKQAIKVSYDNLLPASVTELDAFNISVYPNPATTQLTISAEYAIDYVEVYSVFGQLLRTVSGQQNTLMTLNTSSYPSGIYLVKINSKNSVYTQRVLIKD